MNATWLWPLWQAIVLSMAWGFTQRGKQRFVQWVTGLALNVEEHTVTQSLVALDRAGDWKALESFAEYGCWNLSTLQWGVARRLDRLPNRAWHGYSRLGRRRHQGPPQQPRRVGHLHLPRVHRPLPQPRQHGPRPQLGRPWGAGAQRGPARPLPARRQPAVLPQGPTARRPRRGRRSSSGPSASCWSRWPGGTPRPAVARRWASSTAASPCAAWCARWSSPTSRASRASTS